MPPSDSVHIRPAEDRDAEAISRLHDVVSHPLDPAGARNRIAAFARFPDHRYLVASIDEEVVGFAACHTRESPFISGRVGVISGMAVSTAHQRKGIGGRLVAAAEDWFRSQGCLYCRVTSASHRTETAHRFYPALGYRQTGVRFDKDL